MKACLFSMGTIISIIQSITKELDVTMRLLHVGAARDKLQSGGCGAAQPQICGSADMRISKATYWRSCAMAELRSRGAA